MSGNELRYSNSDKSMSGGGWILEWKYLIGLQKKLRLLDEGFYAELETIEAILLIANGEEYLVKKSLERLR